MPNIKHQPKQVRHDPRHKRFQSAGPPEMITERPKNTPYFKHTSPAKPHPATCDMSGSTRS